VPDITDPQVVKFARERARPFADQLEQTYQTAKRLQQEWAALVASVTPANTADQVADGSQQSLGAAADGRKVMTGQALTGLKAWADQLVTWFETVPGGQTLTRIVLVQQVTVNGQPRF
jgi:hypothetical protein